MNQSPVQDRRSSSTSQLDARRRQILVVEDNKADLFLIRKAIEAVQVDAELNVVSDGHAAIGFFDAVDAGDTTCPPDLVLLDLNLPKRSGEEVLKHLRNSDRCRNALVLIVTSSDSTREREAAAALSVIGYFRKPSQFAEFMKLGPLVKQLLEAAG